MKPKNFFSYFPVAVRVRAWDLYATSFGFLHVPPLAAYPVGSHPARHHFVWENGRVLQEYQLLYIHEGEGVFESALTKPRALKAPIGFVLFPDVWHRYRPNAKSGWVESWIELKGTQLTRLQQAGILDPRHPFFKAQNPAEIESLWEQARLTAQERSAGFSVKLGLLALQILHSLSWSPRGSARPATRAEKIIVEAQAQLSQESVPSPADLARRLGLGYSYFRRIFKKETGFSPKEYQLEVRHRRSRELLRDTSLSIKEVASQLHYNSPFHFSKDFAARAKMAPSAWRLKYRSKA